MSTLLLSFLAITGIFAFGSGEYSWKKCPKLRSFAYILNRMPNLEEVPNPCALKINQASACESALWLFKKNDSSDTTFYTDFQKNFEWAPVFCGIDSDGDGRTNGEELGDPRCEWNKKMDRNFTSSAASHPAICEPVNSEKCLRINNGPICKIEEAISPLNQLNNGVNQDNTKILMTEFPIRFLFPERSEIATTSQQSRSSSMESSARNLEFITILTPEPTQQVATASQQSLSSPIESSFIKPQFTKILTTDFPSRFLFPERSEIATTSQQSHSSSMGSSSKNLELITLPRPEQTQQVASTSAKLTWQDVSCQTMFEIFFERGCKLDIVQHFLKQLFFEEKVVECWTIIGDNETNKCPWIAEFLVKNIPKIRQIFSTTSSAQQPNVRSSISSFDSNNNNIVQPIDEASSSTAFSNVVTSIKSANQNNSHYDETTSTKDFLAQTSLTAAVDSLTINNIYLNAINILNRTITKLIEHQDDSEYKILIDFAIKNLNDIFNLLDGKSSQLYDSENLQDTQNYLSSSFEIYWSLFEFKVREIFSDTDDLYRHYKIKLESIKNEIRSLGKQKASLTWKSSNDPEIEMPTWNEFASSLDDMIAASEEYRENTITFFDKMEKEAESCIDQVKTISTKTCKEIFYCFQSVQFIYFTIQVKACWRSIVYEIESACYPEPFDFYEYPRKFSAYKQFFKIEDASTSTAGTHDAHKLPYTIFDLNAASNVLEINPIKMSPDANDEFWDEFMKNETGSDSLKSPEFWDQIINNESDSNSFQSNKLKGIYNWRPKQVNINISDEVKNVSESFSFQRLSFTKNKKESNASLDDNFVIRDNQTTILIETKCITHKPFNLRDVLIKISAGVSMKFRVCDIPLLFLFHAFHFFVEFLDK